MRMRTESSKIEINDFDLAESIHVDFNIKLNISHHLTI